MKESYKKPSVNQPQFFRDAHHVKCVISDTNPVYLGSKKACNIIKSGDGINLTYIESIAVDSIL